MIFISCPASFQYMTHQRFPLGATLGGAPGSDSWNYNPSPGSIRMLYELSAHNFLRFYKLVCRVQQSRGTCSYTI